VGSRNARSHIVEKAQLRLVSVHLMVYRPPSSSRMSLTRSGRRRECSRRAVKRRNQLAGVVRRVACRQHPQVRCCSSVPGCCRQSKAPVIAAGGGVANQITIARSWHRQRNHDRVVTTILFSFLVVRERVWDYGSKPHEAMLLVHLSVYTRKYAFFAFSPLEHHCAATAVSGARQSESAPCRALPHAVLIGSGDTVLRPAHVLHAVVWRSPACRAWCVCKEVWCVACVQ